MLIPGVLETCALSYVLLSDARYITRYHNACIVSTLVWGWGGAGRSCKDTPQLSIASMPLSASTCIRMCTPYTHAYTYVEVYACMCEH